MTKDEFMSIAKKAGANEFLAEVAWTGRMSPTGRDMSEGATEETIMKLFTQLTDDAPQLMKLLDSLIASEAIDMAEFKKLIAEREIQNQNPWKRK